MLNDHIYQQCKIDSSSFNRIVNKTETIKQMSISKTALRTEMWKYGQDDATFINPPFGVALLQPSNGHVARQPVTASRTFPCSKKMSPHCVPQSSMEHVLITTDCPLSTNK